jgi:aspartyl aminopeptidase
VNKEDHLQPILATEALKSLSGDASAGSESAQAAASEGASETPLGETPLGEAGALAGAVAGAVVGAEVPTGGESRAESDETKAAAEYYDASSVHGWANGQEPLLVSMLAEELGVPAESILDFECSLFDTQPAALSGVHSEFLVSSRLDNLASCFVATEALIEHAPSAEAIKDDPDVSLIALFDHEEVGSGSTSGAGSPVMGDAVRRISSALSGGGTLADDVLAAALSKSFVLSADMAHAVHPNYASKHEKSHGPQMNRGIVIKSNSNQRYASNGVTSFVVRELSRRAGLPAPQEFVVRNDCPCGSTIGPIISASTGMRAVDVGMPMLSMHSVREVMGVADLTHGKELFAAFLRDFREIDAMLDG